VDCACGQPRNDSIHSRHTAGWHPYKSTRRPGIKPVSDQRRLLLKESGYAREALAAQQLECVIKSPVCRGRAQHLHEILPRGRGGGLKRALRSAPKVPACDPCNDWVSEHPREAHKLGWLIHSWEAKEEGKQ
jgi:hypothetical protein